jgi:hypothetical protein
MFFLVFSRRVFKLEVLSFPLHLLNKILPIDHLQMPDTSVLVTVLGAIFRINVLARINLYLKMLLATLQCTTHYHGHHFGVSVLEGLVFDVNILRLGPFPDTVSVLAVFRAVL